VRSTFADGPDGWRSYNNSHHCPGGVNKVRGVDRDEMVLAFSDRCQNNFTDGGGIHWDEAMQHLYLSDRLPYDRGGAERMYFRAPPKFLGDHMGLYNHTLTYDLHAVLADGTTGGTPHSDTSADVILVGGRPTYSGEVPDFVLTDKFILYDWSRAQFPELPLNIQWSKGRLVSIIEQYMATPQVFLAISTDEVAADPDRVGIRDTPVTCQYSECITNFNFDFREGAGWVNIPTIPSGFGWSRGNPYVNIRDNTVYVGGTEGFGTADAGTTVYGSKRPAHPNPFPSGEGNYGTPLGDDPALLEKFAPLLEQQRVGRPGTKDLAQERLSNVDRDSYMAQLAQAYAAREALAQELSVNPLSLPLAPTEPPVATQPGLFTGGGLEPKPFFPSVDNWDGDRLHWDLLPEVHRAIDLKRRQRYGQAASLEELLWALGSVTELLLRADYQEVVNAQSASSGRGEVVRLDNVAYVERDPLPDHPRRWQRREHEAYMQYLSVYGDRYEIAFLREYFDIFAEELRLSICSGNGVWEDGIEFGPCICAEGWVGTQCEFPCPLCLFGKCNLEVVTQNVTLEGAGVNGTDLETTEDVNVITCACNEGYVGDACNLPCPQCGVNSTCIASSDSGPPRGVCDCEQGITGDLCDITCIPCDFSGGKCVATGDPAYPSACECLDTDTGLLCDIPCPAETCNNGRCTHPWDGKKYEDVAEEYDADENKRASCECVLGWGGTVCEKPCPGTPDHETYKGKISCSGRGTCSLNAECVCNECTECTPQQLERRGSDDQDDCCIPGVGIAAIQMLRFDGEVCENIFAAPGISTCGNGMVNPAEGEECDDGNRLGDDGCDENCKIETAIIETAVFQGFYKCKEVQIAGIMPPRPEWELEDPIAGKRTVCVLTEIDTGLRRRLADTEGGAAGEGGVEEEEDPYSVF